MLDTNYDRINEYSAVRISLASPADVRSWSYGEVTEPETINYRTYRPERDGLFCERIFGPEKDWECSCGKYRGMKHKGIVCDRCGVKVTHSRVRRSRMGHINLAAPVVHIWFFKSMPCRIGNLLGMKSTDIQRVVYFQSYAVTDPRDTPLEYAQLLTEEEYRDAVREYGPRAFEALMGADAIGKFLENLDLNTLCMELRAELKTCTSKARRKTIIKQITEAEALRDSDNRPEWMVMDVIPVIPPDLRPLVLLDNGSFASSDLNDLYRRIINRNNRLQKLLDLNAPDVIIRNEKRMLQQAVDALFDNGRCKRPVVGSSKRPLKSLTDMIKGKQGRFRENLLGKRVDYSARSVIVVGPELKLDQCGLPKKIALELYQPFIIRRLKERGVADSLKSAKKELEQRSDQVWDILDEVIDHHPVLLNRAPTLHRMGIQAFNPVLVEGNAIRLHPLACSGFNADFDGDAMAVHLPLSVEAQVEAKTLMMAPHNVFTPQDGRPIMSPSLDIVLGCYYLTVEPRVPAENPRTFSSAAEVFMLLSQQGHPGVHEWIDVRLKDTARIVTDLEKEPEECPHIVRTTVGRIQFNDKLPNGLPFYNCTLPGKGLSRVIHDCYEILGRQSTVEMLDEIKHMGFRAATLSGVSFAMVDLKLPDEKQAILAETEDKVADITRYFREGAITDGERRQRVIDEWTAATDSVADGLYESLRADDRMGPESFNPVFMMMDSGARGKKMQVSQLAGMRGLMAKPSGDIIETPIKASFREGLDVLEYFSSTHGARKGLADTALKTAESGYLTRRLADVAQNVIISIDDCGTIGAVTKAPVMRGDKIAVPLREAITGRIARDNIVDLVNDEIIVSENQLITEQIARRIETLDERMKVRVRSPLTCESRKGICAACYGMDLSRKRLAELGLTAGIIAAQSIGEPGTQLTMRTFHTGGVAVGGTEESHIGAERGGTVLFIETHTAVNTEGKVVCISRQGEIAIMDAKGHELDRHGVPHGAEVLVKDGQKVRARQKLAQWDTHFTPILAEVDGKIRYEDIVEGKTLRIEVDEVHNTSRAVIMEHRGDMHPQILIEGPKGGIISLYPLPEKAIVEVQTGQKVSAGTRLARTTREVQRTQDITGGLPRVTELLEARVPKDPAVISEIDGVITSIERRRGRTVITVRNNEADFETEHIVPAGKHLRINRGDNVKAGQPLVDGPLVLDGILRINGEEALHNYILQEIQNVYRLQDASIDDKHFEIIIRQVTSRVRVLQSGDTKFLPEQLVNRFLFRDTNTAIVEQGGEPATAEPVLLGITKAALASDSFISAASFQNTTRVLTQAALAGKIDRLEGLKENVILGHLVPTGTGFRAFCNADLKRLDTPGSLLELEEASQT